MIILEPLMTTIEVIFELAGAMGLISTKQKSNWQII
jgi:hypothetical protein